MKHDNNKQKREIRVQLAPQRFEVRKNADGSRSISGYAATFGDLSQDLGGFRERIQQGAFTQSLKDNPDVLCLYAHNNSLILGRVQSGSLAINEDAKGLRFTCKLPDTTTARDLIALMERGDVSQMSFGFSAVKDDWQDIGGQVIRTLIQVQLFEISVVGQPAYTSTSVNLRSCPVSLRSKLAKRDDDNLDDCDEDDLDGDGNCTDAEDRDCSCMCVACQEDRCSDCTNTFCEDDACRDCPTQTREAHMSLIFRKLRS